MQKIAWRLRSLHFWQRGNDDNNNGGPGPSAGSITGKVMDTSGAARPG
jgi:hypothetical protein